MALNALVHCVAQKPDGFRDTAQIDRVS